MSAGRHNSVYPKAVEIVNEAVPNGSLTEIFSGDGEIYLINVSNTTGGALTLLMQDEQASPLAFVPTVSIPANTLDVVIYDGVGLLCKGGAKWQASAPGLVASVRGRSVLGLVLSNGFV